MLWAGIWVAAQHTEAELYADLHTFRKTLPWSREPHDGWPDEAERGRKRRGRPASPGWTPEQHHPTEAVEPGAHSTRQPGHLHSRSQSATATRPVVGTDGPSCKIKAGSHEETET
ncbi:hypothetical protein ACFY2M_33230 [Streptomyces sp. NPDC001276]|uniref:hypothetical protein n=1 Tax=Streptomyces sp. NPDC001276 TaxID=3364555 RepID=UPI0036D03611